MCMCGRGGENDLSPVRGRREGGTRCRHGAAVSQPLTDDQAGARRTCRSSARVTATTAAAWGTSILDSRRRFRRDAGSAQWRPAGADAGRPRLCRRPGRPRDNAGRAGGGTGLRHPVRVRPGCVGADPNRRGGAGMVPRSTRSARHHARALAFVGAHHCHRCSERVADRCCSSWPQH